MRFALKLRPSSSIAVFRVVVAAALLGTRFPQVFQVAADWLMAGYFAWSLVLLILSRVNWWLSYRTAKAALAVDFVVAFTLLYLTEVVTRDAISPFMALFVFLLLSATAQWRVKGALITTALSLAVYLLVGLALYTSGEMSAHPLFVRRLVFIIAISGFVAWFGLQYDWTRPERLDWPLTAGMEEQFATIAQYTLNHLGARGLGLVWAPKEEPWTVYMRAGTLGESLQKVGPRSDLCGSPEGAAAVLFDRARHRVLLLDGNDRVAAEKGPVSLPLADELGVRSGIAAPIPSDFGCGVILLTGIPGVSADDLCQVRTVAEELGRALDRHEVVLLMQHQEAIRLRADFARDLHDSVAQSLAGSEFRISALREAYAAGEDVGAELADIQQALGQEARHVHDMIADLRRHEPQATVINPGEALRRALEDAASRWGIRATVTNSEIAQDLRKWVVRELQLIIREAVANAVRHAGSTHVTMSVQVASEVLLLQINDDGAGFAEDWLGEMPQSISERVDEMGGTMKIDTEGGMTRLAVTVPLD